jgi:hypothetical protein
MVLEKFTLERNLIYVLIFAVLITFGFIFYLFFGHFTKSITVTSPTGGEEWEIGQTYKITWESKGVDKVGIVLFDEQEPKWIAKNIPAGAESYEWKIYPGQNYKDGYWIAVFEYPWQKGNEIDYSSGSFAVVYSEIGNCDSTSLKGEWPYIASDFPNVRRVFITESTYSGNLEGFVGANTKCQEEAEKQGLTGNWQAFLGGDSLKETAVERLRATDKGTKGVFVQAFPSATLLRGATCHRLLGKDFDSFLGKFSELLLVNQEKIEDNFSQKLRETWTGRIDGNSKENCIGIEVAFENTHAPLSEKYSFTSTCQNWTKATKFVQGYPVPTGTVGPSFATCYTAEGKRTEAVALGGLATGLTGGGIDSNSLTLSQGKTCDVAQRLICIEE